MTEGSRRIVAKFDDAAKLMALRRRAHRLGLLIVTGIETEEREGWELAGPYTLVCAETGYFAHAEGVNLRGLSEQISQIEDEGNTA